MVRNCESFGVGLLIRPRSNLTIKSGKGLLNQLAQLPSLFPRNEVLLLLLVLFSISSFATIHTIKQDGTGDHTSIQAGINVASNGDTVLVWPGTYFENIDYNEKSITVASLYLSTQDDSYVGSTIIDGNHEWSCVTVSNCTEEYNSLVGFTIQNGAGGYTTELRWGGGLMVDNSHINISRCVIKNCFARSGGAMYCRSSQVYLSGTRIFNNIASSHTGGILNVYDNLIVFDTIDLNSVYLNFGPEGCDFSQSASCPPINIVLDTGTVISPDNYFYYSYDSFGYPTNEITWQINNGIIEQINADLFISPTGDNTNCGLNPDEPLRNLAYALRKIIPDSLNPKSIYFAPGNYSLSSNDERFPIVPRSHVSLIGDGQATTFMDAENMFPLINSYLLTNNFMIKNITFMHGIDSDEVVGGTGGLEFYDNTNIKIKNVTIKETHGRNRSAFNDNLSSIIIDNINIHSNNGGTPLIIANTGESPEYKRISNSKIHNNVPGPENDDGIGGGVGIFSSYSFPGATQVDIINSTITNNILTIEQGTSNSGTCGLTTLQNAKVNVINSNIANNEVTNPIPSSQVRSSEGAVLNFYNSLVHGIEDYEIFLGNGQPTSDIATVNVSYSNVKGGEENIQNWNNIHNLNWLEGNIEDDPLWIGGEPYSYELQPNSPCINAGVPMYEAGMDYPYIKEEEGKYVLYMLDGDTLTLPTYDLAGNPRISGGRIDMGAYEWQDTTTASSELKVESLNVNVFPNPFHSNLFLAFETANNIFLTIDIIDIKGIVVKKFVSNNFPMGMYKLVWDGQNEFGEKVKTGTYFVIISSENHVKQAYKVLRR